MEFYDDLHDIYDLVTLGDENVVKDKPHFPGSSIVQPVAAPGDEHMYAVDDKPLAPG
jgi:hypothetical protein